MGFEAPPVCPVALPRLSSLGDSRSGQMPLRGSFETDFGGEMIYTTKYFKPQELVSKEVFNELLSKAWIIWNLFDDRILLSADQIREHFGRGITINSWHIGGPLNNCGWRAPGIGVKAKFSQHFFGRALDLHINGVDAEEARQVIIRNRAKFPHVRRMEEGVAWVHIDNANTEGEEIRLFKP